MVENTKNLHRKVEAYEERFQRIVEKLDQLIEILSVVVANQNA